MSKSILLKRYLLSSDHMDGKADIIRMNDKQFEIIVDNVSHAPSEMFQHQSIDVSGIQKEIVLCVNIKRNTASQILAVIYCQYSR